MFTIITSHPGAYQVETRLGHPGCLDHVLPWSRSDLNSGLDHVRCKMTTGCDESDVRRDVIDGYFEASVCFELSSIL